MQMNNNQCKRRRYRRKRLESGNNLPVWGLCQAGAVRSVEGWGRVLGEGYPELGEGCPVGVHQPWVTLPVAQTCTHIAAGCDTDKHCCGLECNRTLLPCCCHEGRFMETVTLLIMRSCLRGRGRERGVEKWGEGGGEKGEGGGEREKGVEREMGRVGRKGERHTERGREGERERGSGQRDEERGKEGKGRGIGRETDRQTDRQTDRLTDRHRDRETETERSTHTYTARCWSRITLQ